MPMPFKRDARSVRDASSSGSRFGLIEAHVEGCRGCQAVVERLASDTSASELDDPERLPPRDEPPTIPGYVIERELGRGGMGVVYQAWHSQLARRVAIKVVSATWESARWIAVAGSMRRGPSGGFAIATSFRSTKRANRTAVSTLCST